MPPDRPTRTERKPFFARVGAQSDDERRVHLLVVVEPVRVTARQLRLVARAAASRRAPPGRSAARPRRPAPPGRPGRTREGQVRITLPSTNCGARATTSPSASTTIESPSKTSSSWPPVVARYAVTQPGLPGPRPDQFEARVVLVPLVRRGVHRQEQPARAARAAGTRPPSCQRSSQIARARRSRGPGRPAGCRPARSSGTRRRPVVGQVVLGEPQHHLAAVQDGGGVLRRPGRPAEPGLRPLGAVQVADDHRHLPEPSSARRRASPRRAARTASTKEERSARSSTGYPVSTISGKRDEVRALTGGVPGPVHDRLGVSGGGLRRSSRSD